jgi:hypothetical protein
MQYRPEVFVAVFSLGQAAICSNQSFVGIKPNALDFERVSFAGTTGTGLATGRSFGLLGVIGPILEPRLY